MNSSPCILVTGGTGFAGSHLIEALQAFGYTDIHSTTFSPPPAETAFLNTERYHRLDLTDKVSTARLIADLSPDWIFHLASFAYVGKSFEKAEELFANNISLQLSLLEGIRLHRPKARILTIGSSEEYGVVPIGTKAIDEKFPLNPVNPYAVSKCTQDLLAGSYFLSFGLDIVRARPFNHIGIRQTGDFAIPSFAKQIVAIEKGEQKELLVGNLNGVRDFTSVKDMVRAYILLMEKGKTGEIYNLGSGKGVKMQEIVDQLCSMAKTTIIVKRDESRLRPLDVPILIADNKKIRELGWETKENLQATLEAVLAEWRQK